MERHNLTIAAPLRANKIQARRITVEMIGRYGATEAKKRPQLNQNYVSSCEKAPVLIQSIE